MEMTQKQIEIEAQNYLNGLDLPENADKQLILENFKNGMTWMLMLIKEEKQQWIDKACEWLRHNMIGWDLGKYPEYAPNFIDDLKKAMEGE